MSQQNETRVYTVAEVADGIRSGEIIVEASDETLYPGALADYQSPDAFPEFYVCLVSQDGTEIGRVTAWKHCWYVEGPNDPSNGAWIGPGYHLMVYDNDGHCSGRPRPDNNRIPGCLVWACSAGGEILSLASSDEDNQEDIDTITKEIDNAYDAVSVKDIDDECIRNALLKKQPVAKIDLGPVDVTVHTWTHLGRHVGTIRVTGRDKDVDSLVHAAGIDHSDFGRVYWDADEADSLKAMVRSLADAAWEAFGPERLIDGYDDVESITLSDEE